MEQLSIREKNWIISAVSCQKTAQEAGLTTWAELSYYRALWQEAQTLCDRGGVWPVFDLYELD